MGQRPRGERARGPCPRRDPHGCGFAGLTWALLEWIYTGKPTVFGTITGSIAGLATITPLHPVCR